MHVSDSRSVANDMLLLFITYLRFVVVVVVVRFFFFLSLLFPLSYSRADSMRIVRMLIVLFCFFPVTAH